MKKKSLILGTLAAAMFVAAGCDKTQSSDQYPASGGTNTSMSDSVKQAATNAWEKTKEVTTNVVAEVKEGTTNAWANFKEYLQSATDYTYDKKDAFVSGASADVDALNQKLNELSDKVASGGDSAKADAQAKLQDLKAKSATLDQKLNDLRNSTAENWNDAKAGFQSAYDDMKNSLKQAWQ